MRQGAVGDVALSPQQRRMLERLLPLIAGDLPHDQIGLLQPAQWRRNLATYHAHGLIAAPLTLAAVADTTLLRPG